MSRFNETLQLLIKCTFTVILLVILLGMIGMVQEGRKPVIREASSLKAESSEQMYQVYKETGTVNGVKVEPVETKPEPEPEPSTKGAVDKTIIKGDMVLVKHKVYIGASDVASAKSYSFDTYSIGWFIESQPDLIISTSRWETTSETHWLNVTRIPGDSILSIEKIN